MSAGKSFNFDKNLPQIIIINSSTTKKTQSKSWLIQIRIAGAKIKKELKKNKKEVSIIITEPWNFQMNKRGSQISMKEVAKRQIIIKSLKYKWMIDKIY